MTVQDDDRDRGKGKGLKAFRAEEPTGEEAKLRLRESGVETNFRQEGVLPVYIAIGIASRHTAHLHVDPFLPRDDVAFAEDVGEVLLVWESVREGDLPSDSEGEVTRGDGGGILDGAAGPSAFDEAKGRASDRPFNGSTNAHYDARH